MYIARPITQNCFTEKICKKTTTYKHSFGVHSAAFLFKLPNTSVELITFLYFPKNVPGVIESLKIITEAKSSHIAKYAFDYAVQHGRKKVTAVHKANIM